MIIIIIKKMVIVLGTEGLKKEIIYGCKFMTSTQAFTYLYYLNNLWTESGKLFFYVYL
jgi:hypothetical protein